MPGAETGGLLDSRRLMGFAFLAPAVVYIALLIGVPFVTAFAYSLSDATVGNTSFRYAGLRNFEAVLHAPDFHAALRNTFMFTLVAQVFVLILAAPLPQDRFVRGGMWGARPLLIMPWATPLALSVIGWLWMFDSKYSPIDYLLEQIGLHGPSTVWGPSRNLTWLGKTYLAKASIIFVHVWRMTPLATVILMAGLSSIPADLSDQGKADGARYFRALFQVKLPLILPIMLNSLLFSFIFTFGDLTVVYVLTRGGPINHTLTLPMYSFLVGIDGGNLSQGGDRAVHLPGAAGGGDRAAAHRQPGAGALMADRVTSDAGGAGAQFVRARQPAAGHQGHAVHGGRTVVLHGGRGAIPCDGHHHLPDRPRPLTSATPARSTTPSHPPWNTWTTCSTTPTTWSSSATPWWWAPRWWRSRCCWRASPDAGANAPAS